MGIGELIRKIPSFGSWILVPLGMVLASPGSARADAVEFTATVDRKEISSDESISLKLSVKTEGNVGMGTPTYSAPEFDLINQFDNTFIESFYKAGRFGVRNNRDVTHVLRPQRTGTLTISNIRVEVAGKSYSAPPVTIQVTSGGGGTLPPKGYGGAGVGLRGAGKRQVTAGNQVFVRAEVDRSRAVKGEQVIVSYYLYRRVRVFNVQVDKYPSLPGFLREDIEMPVLGARLPSEVTILDGVKYERSLLVRYAAYPLKEGKLTVDPMQLRATYYVNRPGLPGLGDDDMDQMFQPFMNFFNNMAPQTATSTSDPVTVEVNPLPEEGRPASFSGAVGQFDIQGAVDRYEARVGEALTLTLKIEGRGNVTSIEQPKFQLPTGVDVYDSKGKTKSGRGGVGERVFEILLIPRSSGKFQIPSIELSYYDPQARKYVAKSTQPIDIQVAEGAPGSAPPPAPVQAGTPQLQQPESKGGSPALRPILPPAGESSLGASGSSSSQTLPWILWLSLASLLGWMGLDLLRERSRREGAVRQAELMASLKSWEKLKADAASSANGAPFQEIGELYERLTGAVYDAIDRAHALGSRSHSRDDLRRMLVEERGLPEPVWKKISDLLEFAEAVRFASSVGAVSEQAARTQLERWVGEGQAVEEALVRQAARAKKSG